MGHYGGSDRAARVVFFTNDQEQEVTKEIQHGEKLTWTGVIKDISINLIIFISFINDKR